MAIPNGVKINCDIKNWTMDKKTSTINAVKIHNFIDPLLVTNPTNIRYLTGFAGAAPEEREAYVLVTKSQVYLFTNSLYREEAKTLKNAGSFKRLNLLGSKSLQGLTLIEISREEPFAKKLANILKLASQGQALRSYRIGFEETDLTVAEFAKLKKECKGVALIPTQGRIEELRMSKRDDEIENIRQAAKLTDQCFDFILGKIEIGVTEADIAWEIESFIRTRGAGLAFSPIVAFGKNTSQPHYTIQPQGPALSVNASEIVLLDFGVKVNGYCSDMTRVVFVGKPKDEWVNAYKAVFKAQQTALEYLHLEGVKAHLPGNAWPSGAQIDRIARKVIEKAGYPTYPHSLGHGVGLDIHEAPKLSFKNPSTRSAVRLSPPAVSSGPNCSPSKSPSGLQPEMVVTIEPAIYIEGSYGIRIEDLVLLKKDGIEILSKSNKEMIIL